MPHKQQGMSSGMMRRWLACVLGLAALVAVSGVLPAIATRSDGSAPIAEPRPAAEEPSAVACTPPPPGETRTVVTYFYYWYDLPAGVHAAALTQPPADAAASYRSVPWLRQQLADMTSAGIDVALAVYWGEAEPSSDVGLVNMAAAAAQLTAAGQTAPRIGMFLDTGLMGAWPASSLDLYVLANQARVYALVHRFYTLLPRSQWALHEGKPMVWLWSVRDGVRAGASFTNYLRGRFAADFGVLPYLAGEASWLGPDTAGATFDDYFPWGTAVGGYSDPMGGIASVGPGYDERLLNSSARSGRFADREQGRFYQRNWEFLLDAPRPLVAIETWSEFHEASAVADSLEYGRSYIDLTRRYVDELKCS